MLVKSDTEVYRSFVVFIYCYQFGTIGPIFLIHKCFPFYVVDNNGV